LIASVITSVLFIKTAYFILATTKVTEFLEKRRAANGTLIARPTLHSFALIDPCSKILQQHLENQLCLPALFRL